MPQGPPERPGWQVRISPAVPGLNGALVEDRVPSGGGVWVGGRWVLTCAHVVGPEPRAVMARFSFAGGEPVPAVVSLRGWLAEQQGDLALLELDRDPPPAVPPAPLRPARAVTGHACAAYGYPRWGSTGGVWSEPVITGPTADRLQLTAQVVQGHQIEKGFSGTGLFDTETGAVVGLVVTRDKSRDIIGGFAIPLQAAAAAFPQLGPWVGWRLGTDRFLRQHWRPRARGGVPGHHAGLVFHRPDRAAAGADRVAGARLAGPGGTGGDRPGRDRQVGGAGVAVRAQRPPAARRDRHSPPSRIGRHGSCPGSGPGHQPRCGPAAWTPGVPPGALASALALPVAA